MIAKTVLSVLIAFSFFACDNPSKPITELRVYQRLSNDFYDVNGHIFVRDTRIKSIYNYDIELNVVHNNEILGNLFIAANDWPDQLDYMPGNYSIDIDITVSDGVMRIIDPNKTLLDLTQAIVEDSISKESDEVSGNTFAYITIHFRNY